LATAATSSTAATAATATRALTFTLFPGIGRSTLFFIGFCCLFVTACGRLWSRFFGSRRGLLRRLLAALVVALTALGRFGRTTLATPSPTASTTAAAPTRLTALAAALFFSATRFRLLCGRWLLGLRRGSGAKQASPQPA
jgi:hypothetical protein